MEWIQSVYGLASEGALSPRTTRTDARSVGESQTNLGVTNLTASCIVGALLHESAFGRTSSFHGQTYPATFVTGVPSVLKQFRTATQTWKNSET